MTYWILISSFSGYACIARLLEKGRIVAEHVNTRLMKMKVTQICQNGPNLEVSNYLCWGDLIVCWNTSMLPKYSWCTDTFSIHAAVRVVFRYYATRNIPPRHFQGVLFPAFSGDTPENQRIRIHAILPMNLFFFWPWYLGDRFPITQPSHREKTTRTTWSYQNTWLQSWVGWVLNWLKPCLKSSC